MSPEPKTLALEVRRTIRATAERIFDCWTQAAHLVKWWGPDGVTCPTAEVDLRVGGRYRIANKFADGTIHWIAGTFEVVERPHRLVYTWQMGPDSAGSERVTVRFERHGEATEVVVVHERIADPAARVLHELGWFGCLDGLAEYLGSAHNSSDAAE